MAAGKIMPRFDMKEGRLVKGMHFLDIRDAGNPVEHALFSRNDGADELAVPGIAATLGNRTTKLEWGKQVTSVTDIPLTVGCGIGTPADTEAV
ncbi:MAG TPA: HisA/HisF-related TIM barrel protein, partial [Deltaproteobacteria bacterium]|nr:HisA/HisF-related TIM barrel protein [Deltaproteobacteria bacterium]